MTTDAARRTIRTVLAAIAAIAVTLPLLVIELQAAGVDVLAIWPWLTTVLAVLAAITRLMSSQPVDDVLTGWGIGRQPKHRATDATDDGGDAAPPQVE